MSDKSATKTTAAFIVISFILGCLVADRLPGPHTGELGANTEVAFDQLNGRVIMTVRAPNKSGGGPFYFACLSGLDAKNMVIELKSVTFLFPRIIGGPRKVFALDVTDQMSGSASKIDHIFVRSHGKLVEARVVRPYIKPTLMDTDFEKWPYRPGEP